MTDIHKNILRGLLIALGVTAAAGVLSVLMENDTMARVTGTGFVAVLSALVMLRIAVSLDNDKLRPGALFGLGVVVIEFLLLLAIIWSNIFSTDTGRLWATVILFFFWAVFTALAIRAMAFNFSKIAGQVGVGFAAVTLLTLLISIWGTRAADEQWGGTTGLLAIVGLAVSCAAVGLGAPVEAKVPNRPWRWIGIAAGAVAIVVGMIGIWADESFYFERTPGKASSLAALVAVFIGFANVAMMTPLKSNQRWLLQGTLAAMLAACFLLALLILEVGDERDMWRFVVAAAIPTACGAIALAAIARLNKRPEFDMATQGYLLIHLTCPRCRSQQRLKPGKSACHSCGLRFDIKVEEPKCPTCDYLLYMYEGDRCPECGEAITTKVAPSPAAPPPPSPPRTPTMQPTGAPPPPAPVSPRPAPPDANVSPDS